MTEQAYKIAVEINEEIRKLEEELRVIKDKPYGAKLIRRNIFIKRNWVKDVEIQLSKDDIASLIHIREKRIEELKQEFRELA